MTAELTKLRYLNIINNKKLIEYEDEITKLKNSIKKLNENKNGNENGNDPNIYFNVISIILSGLFLYILLGSYDKK